VLHSVLALHRRGRRPCPGAAWRARDSVAAILRAPGSATGGYFRYGLPRRDITLHLGDVTVAPALALGSWVGFSGDARDATVTGDLVLVAGEVKPVLAELARQGLDVMAVHTHLAGEEPRLTYVHFHGEGVATELAARLDRVLLRTGTPRPVAAAPAAPLTIDTALEFRTLGASGAARGNVAQLGFVLVREPVTMRGRSLVPAMNFGSPVNIQAIDATRAVATGDFAALGAKVGGMLTALAAHGIAATAVHTHLIDESPRIYYIHFWADGPLTEVLAGLCAALDAARGAP
jgi:Domain of Unknown Function (DUF1259)